jgi:hypothetical protein
MDVFTVDANGNLTTMGSATTTGNLGTNGNLQVNGNVNVGGTMRTGFAAPGTVPVCLSPSGEFANCSSSIIYKKDISNFGAGLDVVRRLRPITFRWKEGGQPDLGLVAEEVNSTESLLVTHNAKGEIEGVKYDRLSAVFINAFKEQQAQIEAQAARMRSLQAEIGALKSLVRARHRQKPVCRKAK